MQLLYVSIFVGMVGEAGGEKLAAAGPGQGITS